MESLEKLLKESGNTNLIRGNWFNIRWAPDFGTGEKFNIGVGFIENGRVYTRMLDYFERVKCLYDKDAIYQVHLVIEIVKECSNQNLTKSPLPQVHYDQKGYAQGASIDEILETLYSQTVTLSKIQKSQKNKNFNSINTERLYTRLVDELKNVALFDFERFVPANPSLRIKDGPDIHDLYIPFRDNKNYIGGLASTVYSDPNKIELNLLQAARDVETALKLKKGEVGSIFVLKPSDELDCLPNKQSKLIESQLDKFDWYMSKQGIPVNSHVTINGLAVEIYDWFKKAA